MNNKDNVIFVQQDKTFDRKLIRFLKFSLFWGIVENFIHAVLKDHETGTLRAGILERWQGRFLAFAEDVAQSAAQQLETTRVEFEQKMSEFEEATLPNSKEQIDAIDPEDIAAIREARKRQKDRAALESHRKNLRNEIIALHDRIFLVVSSCDRLITARQAEVYSGCYSFAEGACRKDSEILRPLVDLSYDMWKLAFREEAEPLRYLMLRYDVEVMDWEPSTKERDDNKMFRTALLSELRDA